MSRTSVPAPKPARRRILKRKQKGYLLVELGLVLVVSTILLTGQFSKIMDLVDQMNADSTAGYMKEVQGGVNRYIEENLQALKTGNALGAAFPAPLQPTIAQLRNSAFKYVDARLGDTTALDLPLKIVLTRDVSCNTNADDPACVISGVAYSTAAYRPAGTLRSDVLAKVVSAIGKDGAMSYAESPHLLRFQGGATMDNPVTNTAGIVAIRVGNFSGLTALLSPYYRLDGTKKLTGSMDANGNDIKAVRDLQVTRTATMESLQVGNVMQFTTSAVPDAACNDDGGVKRNGNGTGLVICSGNKWRTVGSNVEGIGDGVGCASAGQFGSNATGAGFICNGSYWTSVNTTASLNASCAPDGRMATSINREQLVCTSGRYLRLADRLSRRSEVSRQVVFDTFMMPKPDCQGGTASYSFELTQTVVDVSVNPPRQAMYIGTDDMGTGWRVKMRVKDNYGNELSANNYAVKAIMKLECAY